MDPLLSSTPHLLAAGHPLAAELRLDDRQERLLVRCKHMLRNRGATQSPLHARLDEGGPHNEVAIAIDHHPMPGPLVHLPELAAPHLYADFSLSATRQQWGICVISLRETSITCRSASSGRDQIKSRYLMCWGTGGSEGRDEIFEMSPRLGILWFVFCSNNPMILVFCSKNPMIL